MGLYINGNEYSMASTTVILAGVNVTGQLKSIDYDGGLEPGKIEGDDGQIIARTRGKYSCTASAEFKTFRDAEAWIAKLGEYPSEVDFDGSVSYYEKSRGIITDKLLALRMKKRARSATGTDAIGCKVEFDAVSVLFNGKPDFKGQYGS